MTEYINAEAVAWKREGLAFRFHEYCQLTATLLKNNPHGLELPTIQKVVGMSAKTAKRVLTQVAVQREDKYYPKPKGVKYEG